MKLLMGLIFIGLVGCASAPMDVPDTGGAVAFIDTGGFDRRFSRLAAGTEPTVEMSFYSPVTPNQLPERLQRWLSAVEKHGGVITVQQPEGELGVRSPAVIASALGSVWTGIKGLSRLLDDKMYASVEGRDAVLVLERNPVSKLVTVAKIEFKRAQR
jgi:hypothetical protein